MPTFPSAVPSLKPLSSYSQQDILDLFDRILPDHYLSPLKDPGPGYEYLQGVAKQTERVSQAIEHVGTGNYALSATGGGYATATIEFYRATAIYGAVTVKAGTQVATAYGYAYITQADVAFTALDLGPHAVQVRSLKKSWVYNLPGQFTRSTGEVVPGNINRIKTPVMEPAFGDPTLQVRQTTDATGGASPMLDLLGYDKGISRLPGETDAQYRPRVVFLPEVVTPNALRHAADHYLEPYLQPLGGSYQMLETWEARYQTAYDFPPNITLTDPYSPVPPGPPAPPLTFSGNVFVYDDPRAVPPGIPPGTVWCGDRYMDENDFRGAVTFCLPNLPCVQDFGLFWSDAPPGPDTAMNAAAFQTPLGRRAITAYDVPSTTASTVLQGCYDGTDEQKLAVYSGLGTVLEKVKAAGVTINLVLEGQ